MSTGVRTRGGYLGWDRDENPMVDMVDVASEQGMATGVVTSARFWADTAAGFAVHAEDDDEADIIDQLLHHEDLDNILDRASDDGFFTMVEAATIDSAAHQGELGRQIEAQVALNDTVEATVKWIEKNSSWEETTLIVTSDHETGNLWGAGTPDSGEFMPITGRKHHVPKAEYTDFTDVDPEDPAQAPHDHTHQLVPLYAKGVLADELKSAATKEDPVRGRHLQNTDIATTIRSHLQPEQPPPHQ